MSTERDIKAVLSAAAGAATLAAPALPEPGGLIARIVATALSTVAVLLDQGQTPEQAIAALHRARRLDTSVEDAAVDALVDAKPPAVHAVIPPTPIATKP